MGSSKKTDAIRILYVEDNKHDQVAFKRVFKASNIPCAITCFEEGGKVIEVLGQGDECAFDIVVSDHGLPGMSGLELCKTLLDRKIPIPVVLLTGIGTEDIALEALKSGIDDYIVKGPSHRFELLPSAIKEVLQRHEEKKARIKAEEQLRRYEHIVSNSTDMQALLNCHYVYLAANPAYLQSMGMTADDLIGRTADEMFGEAYFGKEIKPEIDRCLSGEDVRYQHWIEFPVNARKYMDIAYSPYRGLNKEVLGFVVTARDITEQKRLETERENLIVDLETKNAEMERFTYTVSHDLKSPLITIGGYIHLIKKALSEGEMATVESDLYRVSDAVETMDQLLTDLLSLSSIGYASTPPQTLPLTQVAEEALSMVKGLLKDTDIQVRIEPNLPIATGDPIRVREIFTNLIENAVKFMGDQRAPLIKVGMRRNQGEAIICVTDNGIGIDPRYLENIFGLFNRLDKAIDGTGVGLALVRRIVEVHGGRIWVESEGDGQGSTFCFTLNEQKPLKQEAEGSY